MSWRDDVTEERPTFAPSVLDDGAEMVVDFVDDGTEKETRKGEAIVFGVVPREVPDGAEDMNEEPIEEGEEYNLMTSSSRLLSALKDFAPELTGETATIRAEGSPRSFERFYYVE